MDKQTGFATLLKPWELHGWAGRGEQSPTSAFVTSAWTHTAPTPCASHSRAACARGPSRRAPEARFAPLCAKACATASPIPLEAPVMTAVLSRRLSIKQTLPRRYEASRLINSPPLQSVAERLLPMVCSIRVLSDRAICAGRPPRVGFSHARNFDHVKGSKNPPRGTSCKC